MTRARELETRSQVIYKQYLLLCQFKLGIKSGESWGTYKH